MSEEGFLSRWSRRKHQADRANPPTTPVEEAAAGAPREDGGMVPQLSAEEIARLPRIEDLTAETDLTQFLRAGIPVALRNAALRRMWALDPAIRDFVGEAREYAYDWNAPGGVPGSGPLLASDDVKALLRRVVGHIEAPPEPARPEEDACKSLPIGAAEESASDRAPVVLSRRHGRATPV